MTPYDEFDEDGTPRAEVWRRQHAERMAQRNFVAPMPAPLVRREPTTIDQAPQWLTPAQPLDVGRTWQPGQVAQEKTSAVDRARGLQLRLWPFLVLYGLAGLAVGGVVWLVAANVPIAALLAVLTFAGAGIFTYRRMNLDDYDHSGAGVERLRITEAAQLQREQMEQTHELRRMALETYLRRLERDDR